jgi:hypothetical protein
MSENKPNDPVDLAFEAAFESAFESAFAEFEAEDEVDLRMRQQSELIASGAVEDLGEDIRESDSATDEIMGDSVA